MRRTLFSFLLAAICANVAVAGPSPTTLEVISGPVFVDQGKGLIAVDRFTLLSSDDRILMKEGSTALLVNNGEGCVMSLRDSGIYDVPDMSNCHAGQARVLQTGAIITPANGVYTPVETGYVGGVAAGQNGILFGLGFAAIVGAIGSYSIIGQESAVAAPPLSSY